MKFAHALLVAAPLVFANLSHAQDALVTGTVTKLPLPRFVSLKPSETPMREGPSKEHRIRWVFKREGLPVEVIAEHDQWRRVRDFESTEGWIYYGRLSNRRTALVLASPKEETRPLYQRESEASALVARLQPGVIANVESCSAGWCRLHGPGFEGWMKKDALWGVYPDEKVN